MGAETVAKDALPGMPRRSSHNIALSRFRGQGEGGKPVRHQIDPEQMDRKKGYRQACQRRKEEGPYLSRIRGEEILDEFSDIVVDLSPLPHRLYDGGEIVVQEDHMGGFF